MDKAEYINLKAELYDEDGYLVRTEKGSALKVVDGRFIPTKIELTPAENPGNKTVIDIIDMKFNIEIAEGFFTQQNMKNIR